MCRPSLVLENRWANRWMVHMLNTVLGNMEDVYHKSWRGVASGYEVSKLKSFACNNNRDQTVTKGSSSHPVCDTTCIDKIWLNLELSSYARLKCGWATPNISAHILHTQCSPLNSGSVNSDRWLWLLYLHWLIHYYICNLASKSSASNNVAWHLSFCCLFASLKWL